MNILILTSKFPRYANDPQPGFVYYLAKEYLKQGNKVSVIAPYHSGSRAKENFEGIDVYRFRYFFPAKLQRFAYGAGIPANIKASFLAKIQAPFFMASQIFSTFFISRKIKPDIIHVNWAFPQGLAAYLSGYPYIMTIYGGEVFLTKRFHLVKLMDFLINKSMKSFSITKGLLDAMREIGFKSKKIGVIPLGVDTNKFHPNANGCKEIRKRFSANPLILNVGRLVEKKGQIYLIRAFKGIAKEFKNAKLLIIGDGYLRERLEREAKSLNLEKNILFLGEIGHQELPKYYCASDIFVLPSIIDSTGDRETQGVVLAEAMACKCPVIATDTGGIPDVVSSRDIGILVPQKDSKKLAEGMIKLIRNKKLREGYAENAYHHVINQFNWKDIAKRYINEIKSQKRPAL